MLVFKKIEITDKEIITKTLLDTRCRCSDFAFANLFCWSPKFNTSFDIVEKTVFLKCFDENKKPFYMMPIGEQDLKQSLQMLIDDAKKNNTPFRMRGVTERMWEYINTHFPDEFEYIIHRDDAEYIYDAEKLRTLAGKKMQKKRNHINRFKAEYPSWEYESIVSRKQLAECIKMLEIWDEIEHKDHHKNFDFIASDLMIKHFFELDLKGGLLRVDNKIIAFTLGSHLTSDTFCVHLEKAFWDYNGAYTMINQQFLQHEAQLYKYINREEDLGIEGIRKAKLSYYPEMLLQEGSVKAKK